MYMQIADSNLGFDHVEFVSLELLELSYSQVLGEKGVNYLGIFIIYLCIKAKKIRVCGYLSFQL